MDGCGLVLLLLDWMQNLHPVQNQIQEAGPRCPWARSVGVRFSRSSPFVRTAAPQPPVSDTRHPQPQHPVHVFKIKSPATIYSFIFLKSRYKICFF